MAGYLHVLLSGLNYDQIIIMTDVYIWYVHVLCMSISTYLYTA